MKTLTALLLILIIGTTCLYSVPFKQAASAENVKITATQSFFQTCMIRYTSYFRSFMPYDEDPCNHMPSHKSVC